MLITGRPEPRLLWYEDGRQIEGKIEHLPNQQMRNVLQIEHLNRSNHGVSYVCAVSNSRILSPLLASITILMRCKYYKRKKKKLSFTPRYFVAQTCYSHFYDGFFYTLLPFKFEIEVIKKIGRSMLNSG